MQPQDDPCDRVIYIEQGRVWLAATARRGKEVICDLPGPGAFFGEDALFGRGERRLSATAAVSTQVLVVGRAHMIRLLRTQPELVTWFVAHLLARHARLEANLTEQLLYSSELRLAHTLLSLADCAEESSALLPAAPPFATDHRGNGGNHTPALQERSVVDCRDTPGTQLGGHSHRPPRRSSAVH